MAPSQILVVEDEEITAQSLQFQLESFGYYVPEYVTTGEDALRAVAERQPDLVLMDINLKGTMDGVQAAEQIRHRYNIPVVYLTGYGDLSTIQRAKATAPFGYLLKPYEENDLRVTLEMALHRHQVERAVRERGHWFSATLASIGDGVIATDSQGRVTFMNAAAEQLTGWQEQEAIHRDEAEVFHLVNERSRRPVASPLKQAIANGENIPLANHCALIARDQCERLIDDCASPIRDPDGHILGGVLVFRDVTERKKVQQIQAKLAAIVEGSEDAIIGRTLDGIITTWNRGAERLFGYTAAEAVGQAVSLYLPSDRANEFHHLLERINHGERVPPVETVRKRKDGSLVEVLLSVSPIRDEEGQVTCAAIIAHDITHIKRLESQLQQVRKLEAIGRLAGGVAHDFNNLLSIINGYCFVLHDLLQGQGEAEEMLGEIAKASERGAMLTRQLLAYSRNQILQPQILNLNELVKNLGRMLARMIGEDVRLVLDLATDLGKIKADPGQLEQVLMNLAANARDAMPAGGQLLIKTNNADLHDPLPDDLFEVRPGPYVQMEITDSGQGMDKETLEHIFEPFFTTKTPGKGTGLGLATVYGIVKQSDGYIRVRSEPGGGAIFQIYLPRVPDHVEVAEAPAAKPAIPKGTETILLVEDEEFLRILCRKFLQKCGYQVLEASNGDQAVEVAAKFQGTIKLLVTDVVMPGLSGRQVAKAVRAYHPEIKTLFMSGYTEDEIDRYGVSVTEVAFLEKPFSPDILAVKVRDVLENKDPFYFLPKHQR